MSGSNRRARPGEWLAYVLSGVPGAALAIAASAGLVSERIAVLAFAPSYVGLNLAHMAATWSRAWLGRESWRDAPIERAVVPAVLVLGAIGLEAAGATLALLAVQYYVSIYHGVMQNYGLLRLGQRRVGRSLSDRALLLDRAACLLLPMAALVYRARAVCHTYEGVPLAIPPAWLAPALAVPGALVLALFVGRELYARARGEPVDPVGVALVVVTNLAWSGLLVTIEHPLLPLYAIASGHYAQQLYFVWRADGAPGSMSRIPSRVRALVAPPARFGFLAGLAMAGGVVLAGLTLLSIAARALLGGPPGPGLEIPPWLAAMIGVNFSHYWLEARIYRRR